MSDEVHFKPGDKLIFRYHSGYGQEVLSADPLVLRGNLRLAAMQQGTTIAKLVETIHGVDLKDATDAQISEGWQARFVLTDIVKSVFNLAEDADVAHAIGCITAFWHFLEKKNPPADSRPASTPFTASISATPPTTDTPLASS